MMFLGLGIHNRQKLRSTQADPDIAILAIVLAGVENLDRDLVAKNLDCFKETDAVAPEVAGGFGVIPLKSNSHSDSTGIP